MNKLIRWCEGRGIALTAEQLQTEIKFNIRRIYSSYPTRTGIMFYLSTNKGDWFLHLFKNGGFKTEDGWDGGNLSSYMKDRTYAKPF